MTNAQLYIMVAVPSAIAFMGFLTTLVGFLVQNKRLDDMRADMRDMRADMTDALEKINLTLEAMRQDIVDIKVNQRGHYVEIANLKDRVK